jgi:benzoate/toluate 1,2-dioxygenase reductase subunit
MSFHVALSFEDGITRFVRCDADETVADASYRARINIPLDCRDGACGTCKAFCASGEYDLGDYIDEALTEEEAERGYVLPCQLTPQSDMVLQIPTTSDDAKTEAATHGGTLTDIARFSDSTVGFTVELDDRDALAFLPGQYVNIAVPGSEVTRSYSFRNGPDAEKVSFLVRILDQGVMSDYLRHQAQVRDRLELTGPMGSFFLRDVQRRALFLAGGTGLAPFLSMLDRLKNTGVEHPVHLIYGVTRDEDLVELGTLQRYAEEIRGFTFDYCVADENSSAPNRGYVTGLMEPQHLNDGDVDVYLCGPPPMVEAVRQHMTAHGITPANFYYEKFNLAAPAAGESAGTTAAIEESKAA